MRNPSNLSQQRSRAAGVFFAAMLTVYMSATAIAQDMAGVTHFIDRNTDRIPALTIFPKYPSIARRDRIEGEVTVCFKIKANGKISRPVVTDRSHRIFSKPSLRAIRKSNYEPIGPRQLLATARTCRIYRFRLEPFLAEAETPAKN